MVKAIKQKLEGETAKIFNKNSYLRVGVQTETAKKHIHLPYLRFRNL